MHSCYLCQDSYGHWTCANLWLATKAPYPLMQKTKNSISQNWAVTLIKMLLHLRGKRMQAKARVNQQGYKYRTPGTLRTVLRFKHPHMLFLHLTTTFHFSNKPSPSTQHVSTWYGHYISKAILTSITRIAKKSGFVLAYNAGVVPNSVFLWLGWALH